MPRARELNFLQEAESDYATGPFNSITDVAGVLVGHTTLIHGEGALQPGQGPVRTGVSVILPHGGNLYRQKVVGAVHTINGYGKPCGFEQVRELGLIESPIALTNTLNVGLVLDALVKYSLAHNPGIGITTATVNALVAETNDGFLNDIQGRHVKAEHVWQAIKSATTGPVAEGAVGAGTGTVCFGWKGGIGTASRIMPPEAGGYTLGALVQTNFGRFSDLTIKGVRVGRFLAPPYQSAPQAQAESRSILVEKPGFKADQGSVVIILATDAPLDARQLERICKRAAAGLARLGSTYGHGSGDFVIGFSTAERIEHDRAELTRSRIVINNEERVLNAMFKGVADVVEEAVLNSLCQAGEMQGRDNNVAYALPVEKIAALPDFTNH